MEFSKNAISIMERAERGKSGAFIISICKGVPSIARCGGIRGEIVIARAIFWKDGQVIQNISSDRENGKDTFLLVDTKDGVGR